MKDGKALTTLLLIKCELYEISDWIMVEKFYIGNNSRESSDHTN